MAKQKKSQRAAGVMSGGTSAATGTEAAALPSETPSPAPTGQGDVVSLDAPLAPPAGRFGIGAYLLFNAIFDGFCLLQLLLVRWKLGEQKGLYFFFGLLMAAFFVVSVFDYLYDRYVDPETSSS